MTETRGVEDLKDTKIGEEASPRPSPLWPAAGLFWLAYPTAILSLELGYWYVLAFRDIVPPPPGFMTICSGAAVLFASLALYAGGYRLFIRVAAHVLLKIGGSFGLVFAFLLVFISFDVRSLRAPAPDDVLQWASPVLLVELIAAYTIGATWVLGLRRNTVELERAFIRLSWSAVLACLALFLLQMLHIMKYVD